MCKLAVGRSTPAAGFVLTFFVLQRVFEVNLFRLSVPVCAIQATLAIGAIFTTFGKLLGFLALFPSDNLKFIIRDIVVKVIFLIEVALFCLTFTSSRKVIIAAQV